MVFTQQLKNWFAKFQKYKVTYKKGFFHLANLANSPYTIIQTFDSVPFCKHDKSKKLITAKTLFLNAQLYYTELEEGLWILVSDLQFKKNVEMTNIYDQSLPINYHFINLHYNETKLKSKSMLINGMLLTDKTWTIFKPGIATADCHFKDVQEYNITIYFTDEWLAKQKHTKKYFKDGNLEKFFQSDNTYVIMSDTDESSNRYYADFLQLMKLNVNDAKSIEITDLVNSFFKQFIGRYNQENINEQHLKLSDNGRKYIQKAEKYLSDNLLNSFPGIESIASHVGVSPTKLKTDFKVIHNQSLYHYYRYHQMHLASKLLTEKASTVKEVASLLGYENASKFAAVFKDQFNVQPSSLVSR